MPTLTVAIAGGLPLTGYQLVGTGQSVQFGLGSSLGVRNWRVDIYSYPTDPVTWPTPSGWTLDGASNHIFWSGPPSSSPPLISALSADAIHGGVWLPMLTINGDPTQVDLSMALEVLLPDSINDVAYLEAQQRDAWKGYTRYVQKLIRTTANFIAGGGVVAPVNLVGTSDVPQLTVKDNGTQTTPPIELLSSGGSVVAKASAAGDWYALSYDSTAVATLAIGGANASSIQLARTGASLISNATVLSFAQGLSGCGIGQLQPSSSTAAGADFTYTGQPGGSASGAGGNVVIAGTSSQTAGGDIVFKTSPTTSLAELLRLTHDGKIKSQASVTWQTNGNTSYIFSDQPADFSSSATTTHTFYTLALPTGFSMVDAALFGERNDDSASYGARMSIGCRNNAGTVTTDVALAYTTAAYGGATSAPTLVVSGTNLLLQAGPPSASTWVHNAAIQHQRVV